MHAILCRASAVLGLAIMLLLGAVAAADAETTVRDFSEVQASPIVIVPNPGGRAVRVEVTTSIDMACSVVFGEDASFGRIAVDADMDGGAHAEHSPTLAGLEPDTEYHYRVQGTAPDGTIYVSEVLRFRTAPEPIGEPTNLALGVDVRAVSSEFSATFAGANAFDGDASTAWSSAGDGDEAWVEIDLGEPLAIDAVAWFSRSMTDGSSITESFRLTVDGQDVGVHPTETSVSLELTAQVLRFDVETSTGGNTGALEIQVLGEP